MKNETPSQPQVDGLTPQAMPSPAAPVSTVTPEPPPATTAKLSKKSARTVFIMLIALAVAYVLPGIVFIAMFPRPDGGMQQTKVLASAVYTFGGVALLLLGLVSLLRISAIKDHPRMRFFAFIRLAAFLIPTLAVSVAVPLLINVEPSLTLEITSPKSQEDMVAPVSVSFGMTTALKYFESIRLTPLKYEWDFNGDSVVDQEGFDPVATYIFGRAGIFSVVARVTMTDGQTKRVTRRFIIPRASFGVLPLQPIIDEPATFSMENLYPKQSGDPQNPGVAKAVWDFDGDGVGDIENESLTASYTYHKLGVQQVSVALTLSNQTQTSLKRTIEVVSPPEQPFPITLETEPATLLGPPPFGVLFTIKTQEPIANVTWDFGNQKTGEGLRVAQVYNVVGNFTATAIVRSETGAVARLSKVVRVTNPLAIPDLSFEGTPDVRNFTIEGEVPLVIDIAPVTAQPLISFSWDAQNATEMSTADKSFHAVYRDTGTFFADLIGVDTEENVFRRRIKITARPAASFVNFSMDPETPTAPALVTFDGSDTFVPNEEITGFEWDFGDGKANDSKFSGARMEHQYDSPGTFTVTLRVRTTSGQSFDAKKTLLVRSPVYDACFLPSRRTGKAPLGVRFDTQCSTGEFVSWMWNFGDNSESDQQNPTHVYLSPGEYKVTVTAERKDGLKSTKSTTISVTAE